MADKLIPDPILLIKDQRIGLNGFAPRPGAYNWRMSWGRTEKGQEQLVIEFDDSWFESDGSMMVLVDGMNMTKREADVLHLTKCLVAIARRKKPGEPVAFP